MREATAIVDVDVDVVVDGDGDDTRSPPRARSSSHGEGVAIRHDCLVAVAEHVAVAVAVNVHVHDHPGRLHRATVAALVAVLATVPVALAEAQSAPASPPKVVVVVAGDPDDALRAAALGVEDALQRSGRVTLPADGGLRDAFRGESGESDDGLERARADRRRLGSATADEHEVLARIARIGGATSVVVVRAAEGPVVEVFDVTASTFYQGRVATTDEAALLSFVVVRARRAEARAREPHAEPETPRAAAAERPPTEEPTPTAAEEAPPEAASEPRPARAFFRKHWAYFVVGGLLAAAVTAAVVTRHDTGQSRPVLRFRPGGD